jgi:hypothetical protein
MPKQKCKTCGKNADSEYCFKHKPRKKIPGSTSKDVLILEEQPSMRDFFLSLWKKRPHRSELDDSYLGSEPLSIYFHHILPKEKYPQAAFDEENIIFLSLDQHMNVENDKYRYEEINKRRNFLRIKYKIS